MSVTPTNKTLPTFSPYTTITPLPFNPNNSTAKFFNPVPLPVIPAFGNVSAYTPIYFGHKRYELNDWLGNVRVVINDRKTPVNSGSVTVSYKPQIISVTDYYSFGSEIRERSYTHNTAYRFSFNGKEDIHEQHFMQDYGARWYNKALGRFISADPLIVSQKKYPWLSSYQFASDMPTRAVDIDGLEAGYYDYTNNVKTYVPSSDVLQRKVTESMARRIVARQGFGSSPGLREYKAMAVILGGISLVTGGYALLAVPFEGAGLSLASGEAIAMSEISGNISDILDIGSSYLEGGNWEEKLSVFGIGRFTSAVLDRKIKNMKDFSNYDKKLLKTIKDRKIDIGKMMYEKYKEGKSEKQGSDFQNEKTFNSKANDKNSGKNNKENNQQN